MVRANRFSQLESNEIVHVENALIWRDLLVNPRTDIYLAQIVGTVWRVQHFRSIVCILLLSNTEVYSHTCLAKRINLESNFDMISLVGHLERIFCQSAFNVEIFEFSIALGGLLLPALLVHWRSPLSIHVLIFLLRCWTVHLLLMLLIASKLGLLVLRILHHLLVGWVAVWLILNVSILVLVGLGRKLGLHLFLAELLARISRSVLWSCVSHSLFVFWDILSFFTFCGGSFF